MVTQVFNLKKEHIIPTIDKGLCNVGFLFGAGTSCEAGYPLMSELTNKVWSQLDENEIGIAETAINFYNKENNTNYDINTNIPDIELLLNMISGLKGVKEGFYTVSYNLEQKIKNQICEILKNIIPNKLENHNKLLNYLKTKIGTIHTPVWFFTTNYDLLIELASTENNIHIENGFSGILKRFFDIDCLSRICGHVMQQGPRGALRFEKHKQVQLKLCKLHGSISWFKKNNMAYEVFDTSLKGDDYQEAMIYPEKKKLDETLSHPYDKLFTYANNVIGNEVKYLITCGYSFRDEHINERLLLPKLKNGSLRVFALLEKELDSISVFKDCPSFNYLTMNSLHLNGKIYELENSLWKFSELVKFITE